MSAPEELDRYREQLAGPARVAFDAALDRAHFRYAAASAMAAGTVGASHDLDAVASAAQALLVALQEDAARLRLETSVDLDELTAGLRRLQVAATRGAAGAAAHTPWTGLTPRDTLYDALATIAAEHFGIRRTVSTLDVPRGPVIDFIRAVLLSWGEAEQREGSWAEAIRSGLNRVRRAQRKPLTDNR